MKRRIIGGLLVGLPLTVFSLLLYLTGAWAELAIVLGGMVIFLIMVFCVARGVQLLEE